MMKEVGIVYDPIYAEHYTGNHPECADRVLTTIKLLTTNGMYGENRESHYHEITPYNASLEQLSWIHQESLIRTAEEKTAQVMGTGAYTHIDGDTIVSEDTLDASYKAAGGNLAAIDAIMNNKIDRGFVLCRPPGHHANTRRSSGFCIFNNIALDVEYLARKKGIKKVAIVDFDVHAGNGTEAIFENGVSGGQSDSEVLIFSLHQHPRTLYPGTCYPEDIGSGKQEGKTCNITLFPGAANQDVQYSFNKILLPMLNEFQPEFILISAGFDAHHSDRLAGLNYNYQLYHWMTQKIAEVSEKYAHGRMLATLEGGYNLDAISKSISNVMKAMRGEPCMYNEDDHADERAYSFTEEKLVPTLNEILDPYWDCLSSS